MAYATRFSASGEGSVNITLNSNVDEFDFTVLEYNDKFELSSVEGNILTLNYNLGANDPNTYVLLYWVLSPREDGTLQSVNITTSSVEGQTNESVTLEATVTDANKNPIKGTVNFQITANNFSRTIENIQLVHGVAQTTLDLADFLMGEYELKAIYNQSNTYARTESEPQTLQVNAYVELDHFTASKGSKVQFDVTVTDENGDPLEKEVTFDLNEIESG